jgi:hypothetical protein
MKQGPCRSRDNPIRVLTTTPLDKTCGNHHAIRRLALPGKIARPNKDTVNHHDSFFQVQHLSDPGCISGQWMVDRIDDAF